ncbi:MiaB/RimO family radical SAM methylthiotransferase [Candidatus Gottesmanbacteria bacterium]|nr:MiaB/RimO family radical SAM methylthiotransferase [Candidatus Gottesmanbacteria bacterium]
MKYFIKTFGCAANVADSERISAQYEARGFTKAKTMKMADHIIINTCMVRESAENRVYGLVHNLSQLKIRNYKLKIVVTGCMVGMAIRDKTGKMLRILQKRLPTVDEFLPIEEVGFDYTPVRSDSKRALVPISNGCNNFCTFCIVPFTRGREISRPFADVVEEVKELVKKGFREILLIGQNVNSYGADLKNKPNTKVTFVKHLGRYRIPTLFPYLLQTLCKIDGLEKIDFISSNPWDFSEELIETIARNPKITRSIHLPVQAGDNDVLKKMNRWYSREQYLDLIANLKDKIANLKLSTDIIVGFPGETIEQFNNTVDLCKKVGFYKAYISEYSDRPFTAAHKAFQDDVTHQEKQRRWRVLEELINKPNLN